MRTLRTRALTAAVGVAALGAGAASAGPMDRGLVPAEATWVLHVDVEAALRTTPIRRVRQTPETFDIDMGDFEKLKAEIGIDVLEDIRGVTVFGTGDPDTTAVLVASTSAAIDATLEKLRADDAFAFAQAAGREFITWDDDGKTQFGAVRPGRNADDRYVFISPSRDRLFEALDVGEGGRASAKERELARLKEDPGAGSVVFIEVAEVPEMFRQAGDDEASRLLEKVRGVRLSLGERGEDVFIDLAVRTPSDEDAGNLVQMAQGLVAMSKLLAGSDPNMAELARLSDRLELTTDGSKMAATFSYSAAELTRLLEEAAKADGEDEGADEADRAASTKGGGGS